MGAVDHIATLRLRMRPCSLDDAHLLHTLWTDPEVRRYLWDDIVIPRERAVAAIDESLESFAAESFGQWVVSFEGKDDVIGFCGLRRVDEGPEVEILYGFHPEHWGRGFAREAGVAMLAHAFDGLGLARVAGRTDSANQASARVLVRLGMEFEGERDVHGLPTLHYAITREVHRERADRTGSGG